MNAWFQEITSRLDRKKADILFSRHALKDKKLTTEDIDISVEAVMKGKPSIQKSTRAKSRICFKQYSKQKRKTYFVIAEYCIGFIKIITVIRKKGKQ